MKKTSFLLIIISLFFLMGCTNKNTPSNAVTNYFHVMKSGAKSNITTSIFNSIYGEGSNSMDLDPEMTSTITYLISRLEVTVLYETVTGDKAEVYLNVKGVDFDTVLLNFANSFPKEVTSKMLTNPNLTQDELTDIGKDILIDEIMNAPIEERQSQVNLTKNGRDWIVNVDDDAFIETILGISMKDLQDLTNYDISK